MKLEDRRELVIKVIEITEKSVVNITNERRIWEKIGNIRKVKDVNEHLLLFISKRGISFIIENEKEYDSIVYTLWKSYSETDFSREYIKNFIHCLISDILKMGLLNVDKILT